jgi:plasmid stabilization system protein ParE
LEDAFWWYECQRSGLGLEFLLAFDAAVESLCRLPEGHELVALRTRKALLRRFPYLVLYAVEAEQVLITAVFHGRRDPRRWSDRVREDAFGEGELLLDGRLQVPVGLLIRSCSSGRTIPRLSIGDRWNVGCT